MRKWNAIIWVRSGGKVETTVTALRSRKAVEKAKALGRTLWPGADIYIDVWRAS